MSPSSYSGGLPGVLDKLSVQKALDAGLNVVMDACIKVEYLRLNVGF
jgi:predicted CoA-binding protein